MPTVVAPARRMSAADMPSWITGRGGDVRAFDRRAGREVYGPHPFRATTDCVVTNGLIRYQVGGWGQVPYLDVMARQGGIWRSVGFLHLAEEGTVLDGLRLREITSHRCAVDLFLLGGTTITVWLHRLDRMLRLNYTSRAAAAYRAAWFGVPPYETLLSTSIEAGCFAGALRLGSGGQARFPWPVDRSVDAWSLGLRWIPDDDDDDQPDSGIASLEDSDGAVSEVTYDAASKSLLWEQGAATLTFGPLTFGAGEQITVVPRHSSIAGRALTVKVGPGIASHTVDPAAVGAGTTEARYARLVLGGTGGTFGYAPLGSFTWGTGVLGGAEITGGMAPNGLIDNVMLFASRLSNDQAAAVADAATALGGLRGFEGEMVWYSPFDVAPVPAGSVAGDGIVLAAAPDDNDLTTALVSLQDATSSGLALSRTATNWDVAAAVATDLGDLAAHREQFASFPSRTIRVRR